MTTLIGQAAVTASEIFMERARNSLAGGDSSTMRVLSYAKPLVADRAEGCRLWDIDGNEYIDLNMSYGPLLLGHRNPAIGAAATKQISERGTHLGFPTEITVRVAEKIKMLFPSMELLRFANSGTEALASAARLARRATKRGKLVMFEGHYHGWSEALFNRYHAPISELPGEPYYDAIPGTQGMTKSLDDVFICRWNDLDSLRAVFADHGDEIAGVLMEPVMGNAGVIAPQPGFLEDALEVAHSHGALVIFDEVITGLRVAPGGAQDLYDVRPDITVVSKAVGGGYPVAAFGASREIMQLIVEGTLFHGGVYSGNALVMAAAEAVLDEVMENREEIYRQLRQSSESLAAGISGILAEAGVRHVTHQVGAMLSILLLKENGSDPVNYRDVSANGQFQDYIALQHSAQDHGVLFHPNMYEPMFPSTAHSPADVEKVLERMSSAVADWQRL